jgi:hypothetical protein
MNLSEFISVTKIYQNTVVRSQIISYKADKAF